MQESRRQASLRLEVRAGIGAAVRPRGMTLVVGTVVKAAALGFIAGAIGVLVFHQGLILVLHVFGAMPFTPYSLKPTAPFGVPQVLSLAFFGGLWGIALILIMVRVPGA